MATKKPQAKATTPRLSAQDKQWQAQDDVRSLHAAAAVQADPTRLKAAQAESQSQLAKSAAAAKVVANVKAKP